jgi:vacuolar-type H+-ATPase subunit I/STV1
MTPTLLVYVVYGTTSIGLTIWLASALFKNGAVFLEDVFENNPQLAAAMNRMLVVGFYMLNLGYAFRLLNSPVAETGSEAAEVLIDKLGLLLLALGIIHFMNMLVFWQIRKRRRLETAQVPVHAQAILRPPSGDPFPV